MHIRTATPLDAQSIGDIRVAAWKHAYREFMPAEFLDSLDPSANLDALRSALQSNPQPFHMTVAEVDDACVGFSIIGKPRYQAPESVAELWAINVYPTHWRGGVGRRLVSEALAQARVKGISAVELWCIEGNSPAARLYEMIGFQATGLSKTTSGLTGRPLTELAYQYAL